MVPSTASNRPDDRFPAKCLDGATQGSSCGESSSHTPGRRRESCQPIVYQIVSHQTSWSSCRGAAPPISKPSFFQYPDPRRSPQFGPTSVSSCAEIAAGYALTLSQTRPSRSAFVPEQAWPFRILGCATPSRGSQTSASHPCWVHVAVGPQQPLPRRVTKGHQHLELQPAVSRQCQVSCAPAPVFSGHGTAHVSASS